MRPSHRRFRWVFAAVAPWALAAGVLVSITASAGYVPYGRTDIAATAPLRPRDVASRAATPMLDGRVRVASLSSDWLFAERAPTLDRTRRALTARDDLAPRFDLKTDVADFPDVDRTLKGDPLLILRPTLGRGAVPERSLTSILFDVSDEALSLGDVLASRQSFDVDFSFRKIERWAPRPRPPESETSPEAAASTPTTSSAGAGATPGVAREIVFASATPTFADAAPLAIAAAPVSLRPPVGVTTIARGDARGRFADLVTPATAGRELRCLAEAVYFEARSEPEAGQAAVAQVVLNRAKSGLYPTNICGVVYQNRHRYLGCQFTFACEGKSLRIGDADAWQTATRVAREVLDGVQYNDEIGGATHYHARYVRPSWARSLKRMDAIGQHVFYRLGPGQT